ncbi:MAG TPA: hypothetical protein VIK10_05145 [Prolixibacteraceae bacterium]
MMPRSLFFLLLTFICGSLFGQMIVIQGQAKDYAGKELTFYTYREPVSHQQTKLATTTIGQDGLFTLTFPSAQTIEVYADLEKFRGTLVVEPGAHYQIDLPPYSQRTVQEAASPYFEPQLYWLGLKDTKPTEINFLVRVFLTEYNRELSVHTVDIYQKKSADTAKAIIARLEKNYPYKNYNYLNILKLYSYADLEFAVSQTDRDRVIQKYFAKRKIALEHPAYQRLFSILFSDYLLYKSQDIKQKNIYVPAMQGDFKGFTNKLTKIGYQQEVAELVAVKCFYDGYYSGKFDKNLMLNGLTEAMELSSYQPLKEVLPGIIRKITQLQEGSQTPSLQLRNQQNVKTSLSAKGKYIYLAFFRSDSKACRTELDSLVIIYKKLNPILTVLPVSLDQNFSLATKLWAEKKYPWDLVTATDAEKARTDYEVKSLPAFYLISADMKLSLSPALAPSHNFEGLFLKIYREGRRGR